MDVEGGYNTTHVVFTGHRSNGLEVTKIGKIKGCRVITRTANARILQSGKRISGSSTPTPLVFGAVHNNVRSDRNVAAQTQLKEREEATERGQRRVRFLHLWEFVPASLLREPHLMPSREEEE
ncbi:unnamed protein product [Caretta caretta]